MSPATPHAHAHTSHGDAPETDAPVQLIPLRFWWLKRVGIAGAGVVILFVILLARVEIRSRGLLESRIQRWRTAGEPVLVKDFNGRAPVPDERNAAALYSQALMARAWPTDLGAKVDIDTLWDLAPHIAEARKVVAINQPMLDLIRQGGAMDEVDWGVRVSSPMIFTVLPALSNIRQAARVTGLAADVAAYDGRDTDAINRLHDLIRLGRQTARGSFGLLPLYVGRSILRIGYAHIERIAPRVTGGLDGDVTSPQTAEALRRLIDLLLDQSAMRLAWRNAFLSQRAMIIDTAAHFLDGSIDPSTLSGRSSVGAATRYHVMRIIVGPLWRRDAVRCADALTRVAEIDVTGLYAQGTRLLERISADRLAADELFSPVSAMLLVNCTSSVQAASHDTCAARMAACALAVRWYELDHGHRPATLAMLVPDYLPAVPIDPFDPDGGPIRYRPDATPARLYSLGVDQVDDGGTYGRSADRRRRWRNKDIVFFLDPALDPGGGY